MAKGKARVARVVSRNPEIIPGLRRYGRVAASKHSARYLHSKKGDTRTAEQKAAKKVATADLSKPKFYAADDIQKPLRSNRSKKHPTILRKSLTPGAVLIILAGRFRGKRVVFLKQLTSGLLLVTGPYKINGVPLRRINQAYVIATSTRLDVSKVDVSKIDDAFFAKEVKKQSKEFLAKTEEKKNEISAARKTEQARVDAALKSVIDAVPHMKHYLNAKFSLTNGQKPHLLKF
jgi:large subunit ribosomal protein L6e